MRSHKTDAIQSIDLFDFLQKLGKAHRLFQVFSVRIDVLPKQHDFLYSVCHEHSDLPDDIFRLSAAFPSTYIRNDAVAAEIIAAKHNIHTGLK